MDQPSSYNRYRRQLTLKEWGEEGQSRLQRAKILVAGAGGLGSPALQYLVAAGTGSVGIADGDIVSIHNLHRQPLYGMRDIGFSKAERAVENLRQLNPEPDIISFNQWLTPLNALEILCPFDLVIDGTDNFTSRYLLNDAAVLLNKPLVYGAVSKFEGQVAIFNADNGNGTRSSNYRDLFPRPPAAGSVANCEEAGVLGMVPGVVGTMQAIEAIKLITGIGEPMIDKLFTWNALSNESSTFGLSSRAGTRSLIPANEDAFRKTDYAWLCGEQDKDLEIDLARFDQLRAERGLVVIDIREDGELPAIDEFEHLKISPKMLAGRIDEFGSVPIVLICQVGQRSLAAVKILRAGGGYPELYSLAGGILAWKRR